MRSSIWDPKAEVLLVPIYGLGSKCCRVGHKNYVDRGLEIYGGSVSLVFPIEIRNLEAVSAPFPLQNLKKKDAQNYCCRYRTVH